MIDGNYDELADAAEDIEGIMSLFESNQLDLTPITQVWLAERLELVEQALGERADDE
jgi:hypothetical protein